MTFQELFDEAMRDLLKKHGVPAGLKEALSKSAARHEAKERKKTTKSSSTGGLNRSSQVIPLMDEQTGSGSYDRYESPANVRAPRSIFWLWAAI